MNKSNFLQDDKGNWSMARFAVLCCVVMGIYSGVKIPFEEFASTITACADASIKYFGIAIAGKSLTKFTEGK